MAQQQIKLGTRKDFFIIHIIQTNIKKSWAGMEMDNKYFTMTWRLSPKHVCVFACESFVHLLVCVCVCVSQASGTAQ